MTQQEWDAKMQADLAAMQEILSVPMGPTPDAAPPDSQELDQP